MPTLIDNEDYHHLTSSEGLGDHSRRNTVVRIVTDCDSEDKALVHESNQDKKFGYENSSVPGTSYFQLYLCLGMLGFVIFWLILMLRIYLPESIIDNLKI